MKILVVAATELEIKDLLSNSEYTPVFKDGLCSCLIDNCRFDVLIGGIGMLHTVFAMQRLKLSEYDLIVNAGICGSYGKYQVGEVVLVEKDEVAWFGKQFENQFIRASELFAAPDVVGAEFLSDAIKKQLLHLQLPLVKGITVNCVNAKAEFIERIKHFYNPDIESMEGAAFYYVCNRLKVPCLQIRSVSNFVAPQNEAEWNIDLAVKNLNDKLLKMIRI